MENTVQFFFGSQYLSSENPLSDVMFAVLCIAGPTIENMWGKNRPVAR